MSRKKVNSRAIKKIKVTTKRGTDIVRISGAGFKPIFSMIGTTTTIPPQTIIKARKSILRRKGFKPVVSASLKTKKKLKLR